MKRLLMFATGTGREGHPSLGLGYIASYLRKNMGHDNIVITDKEEKMFETIKKEKPDVIGIGSSTPYFNQVKRYSKQIKEELGVPIIIGGVHITALPKNLPTHADIAVMGEGELTMLDLMKIFEKHGNFPVEELKNVRGIAYRVGDEIVINPRRELIKDIDSIPRPARDLFKMKDFYLQPRKSFQYNRISRSTNMVSSRGCPYNCIFCSSSNFWSRLRMHSAEYVASEIKWLIDTYNINEISIFDDLFIASKDRLQKIVELLEKDNIPQRCTFRIYGRANLITDEICQLLKRMNVQVVAIGFETGSQRILDYLKSGIASVDLNRQSIHLLKKYDITVDGLFMINTPTETKEEMLMTLKFIQENPIDTLEICITTPFPGTQIWQYAKKEGFVSDDMNWDILSMKKTGNPYDYDILLDKDISVEDFREVHELLINEMEKKNYAVKFKWSDIFSWNIIKMALKNPRLALKHLYYSFFSKKIEVRGTHE